MSGIAVIGMQWGDEGKGKVIDLLSSKARHIVRAQGGNNAGHTIVAENREYRFHLVPSGIIYPHTKCYIGGGTVVDPPSLLQEIEGLKKQGISYEDRLFLSPYAHVVMPYHRTLDALGEKALGEGAIGTTGRGIGPCYVDKANRSGIRIADFLDPHAFRKRLEAVLGTKNQLLEKIYNHSPLEFDLMYNEYLTYAKKLKEFVAPVEELLYSASRKGENILFEGAQGALLDNTFGTYPYVTSSSTLSGGIASGAGIGPSLIDQTIGVAKVYTTRVGKGPFPTELKDVELSHFPDHQKAREFGVTTGRKRRIGWLDALLLRHTICLNGVDSLGLMKLDILDGLDEIKICTGYKHLDSFPASLQGLMEAEPIYESHPGWKESIKGVSVYNDLPSNAKAYLRRIEELCSIPISLISIGPEREKTLWLDRLFE